MNHIEKQIKLYSKQLDKKNINCSKLRILKSGNHNKLYYMTDFICYLNESTNNHIRFMDNFFQSKNHLIHCLYCIHNNTPLPLVELNLKELVDSDISSFIKVIIISPNRDYFQLAIKYNLEYIICPKNEYKKMIHVGLVYVKSSSISSDIIMVFNDRVLINKNLISTINSTYDNLHYLYGQSISKFVNLLEGQSYNLTLKDGVIIENYFFIHVNLLNKLNWAIFNSNYNLKDIFILTEKRFGSKVFKIYKNFSLNFTLEPTFSTIEEYILEKDNVYEDMEYVLLENFNKVTISNDSLINSVHFTQYDYEEKGNKINLTSNKNKLTRSIVVTNNNKNITPIINENRETIVHVNKYYFVVTENRAIFNKKLESIKNVEKLNYNTIYGRSVKEVYIEALKNAYAKGFDKIIIIEDHQLTQQIVDFFITKFYFNNEWDLIILVRGEKDGINYKKFNNVIKKFSDYYGICLKINLYKKVIHLVNQNITFYNILNMLKSKYIIYSYFISIPTLTLAVKKKSNVKMVKLKKPDYSDLTYNGKQDIIYKLTSNVKKSTIIGKGKKIDMRQNNSTYVKNIIHDDIDRYIDIMIKSNKLNISKSLIYKILSKNYKSYNYETIKRIINDFNTGDYKKKYIVPVEDEIHQSVNEIFSQLHKVEKEKKLKNRYNINRMNKSGNMIKNDNDNNDYEGKSLNIKSDVRILNSNMSYKREVIQSLWIGDDLTLNEVLCIMSFIKNGHQFHLYTYGEIGNIPTECVIKNGNEIIPEKEIFYYSSSQSVSGKKRPTAFSNMFRYKLLYDKGGFWVDMDMVCLKAFIFPEPYVFSSESTFGRPATVNAGVIKCPPRSEFAKYCYNICVGKNKSQLKWGEIGPKLVRDGIMKYNLRKYIKPYEHFCPIGYENLNSIITPSKLVVGRSWYGIHLWNEFWIKNNLDKNKLYYGSLFCKLAYKYCRKYIKDDNFNLERKYGKYNKSCVLFYWMPHDQELEENIIHLFNKKYSDIYNIDKCYVHMEETHDDKDKVTHFINSDIYIALFMRLLDKGVFDNLHIIFGIAKNNKYLYGKDSLFNDGNYYNLNNKIFLWKLNDIDSLLGFTHANTYFYKGYGNYEHFYSLLTLLSPQSIFIRYLATALPYKTINDSIIIDNNYVNNYGVNQKIKQKLKNSQIYFKNIYSNYDLVYIESMEKIKNYKVLFPNAKDFIKMNKFSLMKYNSDVERIYDLVFCASDIHPSKNWEIFFEFLSYCEKNRKSLNIAIITPVILSSNSMFSNYLKMKYVTITLYRNLKSEEVGDIYNKSKTLLVTFGRDANPRVISESLSCGCFNIVLDILSDGKDIISDKPEIGKLIHIKNVKYNPKYQSLTCSLTSSQCQEIYELIKKEYDHEDIQEKFSNHYNINLTTQDLSNRVCHLRKTKQKMIITLATEDYSNNLNYLLSSLKYTNPKLLVTIYCVNWRESLTEQFKTHYPNYYFKDMKLKSYTKGDIIKLKVKVQHEEYMQNMIPFIWIDADSIVLKDITPLFNQLNEHTFICYHRPEEKEHMKFAVGVIGYGVSDKEDDQEMNIKFIDEYSKSCETTNGYKGWFYDQMSLYETFEKYKDQIKLYDLNEHEHSIRDTPNTIVYSRRLGNKVGLKNILTTNKIKITPIKFGGIKFKYD